MYEQGRIPLQLAVTAALCAGATGCLSFEKRWEEAAAHLIPPGSFSGRWQGTWASEESGQSGRLRCIITPLKDGRYEARFHGVCAELLPFEQVVKLAGENRGGLWHYAGTSDMGWPAGGVYTFKGKISEGKCFGTYESRRDYGVLDMRRPD